MSLKRGRLSKSERETILDLFRNGQTVEQISEELNRSVATVEKVIDSDVQEEPELVSA